MKISDSSPLEGEHLGPDLIHAVRTHNLPALWKALDPRGSLEHRDSFGCTALHWAANNGQPLFLKTLLQAGASVDAVVHRPSTGTTNTTALTLALYSGSLETVKGLLDFGAAADGIPGEGPPPICHSVLAVQAPMMHQLLLKGCDPNRVDLSGSSALMLAAEQGHLNLIELLLAFKADWNLVDRLGCTASERARKKGCHATADRLNLYEISHREHALLTQDIPPGTLRITLGTASTKKL